MRGKLKHEREQAKDGTNSEEESQTTAGEKDDSDVANTGLSSLEKAIVEAACSAIVGHIKADSADTDDEKSWKETVLSGFEDAWENLEPGAVWQRLGVILAYQHDHIPVDDVNELMRSDIADVLADLKDNIIEKVINCDEDYDSEESDDTDADGENTNDESGGSDEESE